MRQAGERGVEAPPAALELVNVSKDFGSIAAVRDLSLALPAGNILSLLGPSGCGKTTTLRIVAGFAAPDRGRVLLGGEDVTDLPPHRRQLGMVFQNYALFPHLTVGQNVAFGLKMRGIRPADAAPAVRAALERVRMAGTEARYPRQLSGGQQQRVALARAIVTRPRLLLLDEPFGALDRRLRDDMQIELKQLQRAVGISFVFVTHDQEEALTISDWLAVMHDGAIEQVGAPHDVFERPCNLFVAAFFGSLNTFEASVRGRENGQAIVDTAAGRWCLPAPASLTGRCVVAVRATDVAVCADDGRDPSGDGAVSVPGHVASVVYKGTSLLYEIRVTGGLRVLASGDRERRGAFATGSAVRAVWGRERTHIFPR